MENFYDLDTMRASGGKEGYCWSCGNLVPNPPRMRIGRQIVMLNHDTKLYPHHLEQTKLYDFSAPVAEVTRHPTNPNLWGLRNLSTAQWTSTLRDGSMREGDARECVVEGARQARLLRPGRPTGGQGVRLRDRAHGRRRAHR